MDVPGSCSDTGAAPELDHVVLGARSRDAIDRLLADTGLAAGSSRVTGAPRRTCRRR